MRRPNADRKRIRAASVELPPSEPRLVSHSFSFPFNPDGARATADEFQRDRFTRVWVGEETTGDGYWHVVGWRRETLTDRAVSNTRKRMVELARSHGGHYDGWNPSA